MLTDFRRIHWPDYFFASGQMICWGPMNWSLVSVTIFNVTVPLYDLLAMSENGMKIMFLCFTSETNLKGGTSPVPVKVMQEYLY